MYFKERSTVAVGWQLWNKKLLKKKNSKNKNNSQQVRWRTEWIKLMKWGILPIERFFYKGVGRALKKITEKRHKV